MQPDPEIDRGSLPRCGKEALQLAGLLGLAALLRVAVLLQIRPDDFLRGGDGPWYLLQGWLIAHRSLTSPLSTVGPIFPLLLALLWSFFPNAPEPLDVGNVPVGLLLLVRVLHIGLSLLVIWLGYRLARRLGGDHRAGMITAIGLGIGPAFVLEPAYILTEPAFIALLTVAIWLYVEACRAPSVRRFSLIGAILGLAALTRPVVMFLPAILIPHLVIVLRTRNWGRWLASLAGTFLLMLLPWMIYLARSTGNPLPEGFSSNLWMGAAGEGQWEGTQETYQMRQEFGGEREDYVPEAMRIIFADPLGWVSLRARNLAAAVLTPHGTSDLGGPSIKRLFGEWLAEGRSLRGLWSIVRAPNFGLKLAVYAFHYFALALGAWGTWALRKHWLVMYSVLAPILYLLAVYAILTVLPRYLFPAEVFVWVLAGIGLIWLWERRPGAVTRGRPSAQ